MTINSLRLYSTIASSLFTNNIKYFLSHLRTSRLFNEKPNHKRKIINMNLLSYASLLAALLQLSLCIFNLVNCQLFPQQQQQPIRVSPLLFPGVSRELASFCAARPSLHIDLAPMVVHVKKNVSFNYKLYLFSGDHVFQTGQIIPRDDFRVHSFPVKFKRMNEFWPSNVPTYRLSTSEGGNLASIGNSNQETLIPVSSDQFKPKQFFSLVPLNPTKRKYNKALDQRTTRSHVKLSPTSSPVRTTTIALSTTASELTTSRPSYHDIPAELRGDPLPGDPEHKFISHDVAHVVEARARAASEKKVKKEAQNEAITHTRQPENPNHDIHFDLDDQVSAMVRRLATSPVDYLAHSDLNESDQVSSRWTEEVNNNEENLKNNKKPSSSRLVDENKSTDKFLSDSILPVGSFSSFHVNLTYLVRKDFNQLEPEIIRILIDSSQFAITQLVIVNSETRSSNSPSAKQDSFQTSNSANILRNNEDYDFLNHKLLRDSNTRITSITQLYEDWITRNYYTIVYVQRKLDEFNEHQEQTIVSDRLIFRGSSRVLLGADQLDYDVKAAAFITEKNGLHYYLEFLTNGKFYLCAIDWTKRPFKIIDSQRFPIKSTKVQLDNEELLLCPPAVCYSHQPIDEIISYGRIQLSEKIQHEALILSSSLSSTSPTVFSTITSNDMKLKVDSSLFSLLNETNLVYSKQQNNSVNPRLKARNIQKNGDEATSLEEWKGRELDNTRPGNSSESASLASISLDDVIEAMKAGSSQLQTRLHLRDWVWILPRVSRDNPQKNSFRKLSSTTSSPSNYFTQLPSHPTSTFDLRYELARRNDIKVKPDAYGYVLMGQEIDASYRVYNELYLISASHLITINYTMANETVVSTHPIVDEFFGLGSTIVDPITGAFYDRYANQIFFFKNDRYVGYDYATRKPLAEFMLQDPIQDFIRSSEAVSMVSTLPVLGILGRQHQVDGVYHDLFTDLVYIFSGMKFYTFEASEFKNGSFTSSSKSLPPMSCVNTNFLNGCVFDQAFPNPCEIVDDLVKNSKLQDPGESVKEMEESEPYIADVNKNSLNDELGEVTFSDQQQTKLRNIASTRAGLLNLLVENSLLEKSTRVLEPLLGSERSPAQEKIVVYLLMAMIGLSALITIVMVVLIINWTRVKISKNHNPQSLFPINNHQISDSYPNATSTLTDRLRTSSHNLPVTNQQLSASGNYLTNQRHHHSRKHHQRESSSSRRSRDFTMISTNSIKPPSSVNMVIGKGSRRQSSNIDNSAL